MVKKAVGIGLTLLAPALAFAQQLPNPPITSPQTAITTLCTIAGWMFTFLIVLAVIFVLWAAFLYLTAGGDSEKVSNANSRLVYAAVAVAVALFAKGFPLLVTSLLGGSGVQGCA